MQLQQAPAPGARALFRDEEWNVQNVDGLPAWRLAAQLHWHFRNCSKSSGVVSLAAGGCDAQGLNLVEMIK